MRYRKLDANGDMTFGQSAGNFWVDQPEGVAQAVQTRLGLMTNEWWLDLSEGTPYATEILGRGTSALYDPAIQARVLGAPGVEEITAYQSALDPETRRLTVSVTVLTQYSSTPISVPPTVLN